jgi:DNA repair exonuclease SbcCD nuclease subunit
MRFAFFADVHLSKYSQDQIEDETNLPERLHSIKSALNEVATYCIENIIEYVFIGGDLLHGKSIIYAIAQEIMIEYFEEYGRNMMIQFYVLDGNHDISGKGNEVVSALTPLRNIYGVRWIKFDETYHIKDDTVSKNDILFVPYSYNMSNIIKSNKARILISHFGLSEATLNSGTSIISDISVKDLQGRYELVLLGHYHKPQQIIKDDISIYYAGSLIQLDWGEKGDEKRFLVIDSDTLDVQSIPLTNYKKHVEIEVTASNREEAIRTAKQAKESGDHVKVIMKELVDLSDLKDEFNIVDKTEHDITDRGITSSMSLDDKLRKYLEIKEIPDDKKELYLQLAKEIINEVEI